MRSKTVVVVPLCIVLIMFAGTLKETELESAGSFMMACSGFECLNQWVSEEVEVCVEVADA